MGYKSCLGLSFAVVAISVLLLFNDAAIGAGDPERGAAAFRACMACHSLNPDEHLTGPSLAHVWGRKAGTAAGFARYSDALKEANVVWNESTLDNWLRDPAKFIPRNYMTFPGINNKKGRQEIIAYLKAVSEGQAITPAPQQGGMGMMMGRNKMDLKNAKPEMQVDALEYCGDTYIVRMVAGETFKLWEFNVRLQTDSSKYGPPKGRPVIVATGMMGDRAAVIFASPSEITPFVKQLCR